MTTIHASRVFIIERVFSGGHLVFGEKVLQCLTEDELKVLTYFVLHRNKSGEGLLKLILASSSFLYLFPLFLLEKNKFENFRILLNIYAQPLLKIKKLISNGMLDSFAKSEVESFNDRDKKLVLYKIIKLKGDREDEFFFDDFDVINLKDELYFINNRNVENSFGKI